MELQYIKGGIKMYREFLGEIADVRIGDQVMMNGHWYEVKDVLPPFMPKSMFEVSLENGWVHCTADHQWKLFLGTECMGNFDTASMLNMLQSFEEPLHVGSENGPQLLSVESIPPEMSCCLVVDSPDHQFEIILFPYDENHKKIEKVV